MKTKKEIDILIYEYIFLLDARYSPNIPAYSSDIKLTKDLLERMELYNYSYIIYAPDETLEQPRYDYITEFIDLSSQVSFMHNGRTLEESICNAALLTKNVSVK